MHVTRKRAAPRLALPARSAPPATKAGLALALLAALSCGAAPSARAVGAWTPLANQAPEPIGTTLLLTDGTVMAQGTYGVHNDGTKDDGTSAHWFRLTPDALGGYANGTWTRLADMHHQRLYYASTVLRDGRVFIAGGEYTEAGYVDGNQVETYDPVADVWTEIAGPGWAHIGDAPVKTLFDGTVLLGGINASHTGLYDYAANAWTAGGIKPYASDEESWALLPDQTVLTVKINNSPNAEKYVPSSNTWVKAGQTPVDVVQASSREIGPGVLLADGRCLFIGATGHTALYTVPSAPALAGTWRAGPSFPSVTTEGGVGAPLEAKDAPACLLVNGKVLCLVAPHADGGKYPTGQRFFEYTPDAGGGPGTLSAAPDAGLDSADTPAFTGRMLALPSGEVLYSNFNSQLALYTPDGGPDPAWSPAVSGLSARTDGSFLVSGTQFNGLSEGAYYGDDASESTNYPLVRLTDGAGRVTYARTFDHSTMGLATGSLPVSTSFTTPPGLAPGAYQLQVVANGIASAPISFTTPMAADVSAQVSVGYGGFTYRRGTKTFAQQLTLTNTGTAPLAGPVTLALDQLGRNARLVNASNAAGTLLPLGVTAAALPAGSPAVTVQAGALAPGASVFVNLSFSVPNFRHVTYAARILSGKGD